MQYILLTGWDSTNHTDWQVLEQLYDQQLVDKALSQSVSLLSLLHSFKKLFALDVA
jgi:hypothetical protein